MKINNKLVNSIVEGIQEKKGKNIRIADLTQIHDTICKSLVICEANSPSHVSAIYDSICEFSNKKAGEKPYTTDGLRNCLWVAMDYGDVIVHVFLHETREFYDIDNLWEDAKITDLPNID